MKVDTPAALLVAEHGDAKAHRQALLGQQAARRGRSRKRFEFWAAVASEIEQSHSKSPRADLGSVLLR
jgi:hypothetical protein